MRNPVAASMRNRFNRYGSIRVTDQKGTSGQRRVARAEHAYHLEQLARLEADRDIHVNLPHVRVYHVDK